MKSDFIFLKSVLCILGIIFITSCTVDLVYTVKEILRRKTVRSLEINMGYQVIFLVGTLPVLVGIFIEAKEPIIHFLILVPYSMIVDCIWLGFVASGYVQLFIINKWLAVGFLIWKVLLCIFCIYFASRLLRKVIGLKKEEEESDFEKTYAFRRFGISVSLLCHCVTMYPMMKKNVFDNDFSVY